MTGDRTIHVFGAKGEVTDVKEMIGRVDPISDDLGVDIQLVDASTRERGNLRSRKSTFAP